VSAIISPCGLYRTRLDRDMGFLDGEPVIGWMLHNPSTADAELNDPTARRGIAFTRREGGRRMIFMNPWAGRATSPADLWRMADPVGSTNDEAIRAALDEIRASGGFVVAAWGRVNPPAALRAQARRRLDDVCEMIHAAGVPLFCLGTNADGSPKHPLYVRSDAPLIPWPHQTPESSP
jgi:hypothetical protein